MESAVTINEVGRDGSNIEGYTIQHTKAKTISAWEDSHRGNG